MLQLLWWQWTQPHIWQKLYRWHWKSHHHWLIPQWWKPNRSPNDQNTLKSSGSGLGHRNWRQFRWKSRVNLNQQHQSYGETLKRYDHCWILKHFIKINWSLFWKPIKLYGNLIPRWRAKFLRQLSKGKEELTSP